MRNQVVTVMQQSSMFQSDMSIGLGNLTEEYRQLAVELKMSRERINFLAKMTSRLTLHEYLVDTDLVLLEELLLSYLSGEATASHAMRLSYRTGLSSLAHYQFVRWGLVRASGEELLRVTFQAMLLQPGNVLEVSTFVGQILIRTDQRAFFQDGQVMTMIK